MGDSTQQVLLLNQIRARLDDLKQLVAVFDIKGSTHRDPEVLAGVFGVRTSPIEEELRDLENSVQGGEFAEAWQTLARLQSSTQELLSRAQETLGGLIIRDASTGTTHAALAQALVIKLANRAGLSWSPVVVIAPSSDDPQALAEDGPQDRTVRLPFPGHGIWDLPLVARAVGYRAAKSGEIASLQANQITTRALVAEAVATCLMGPSYAYAAFLLEVDPTRPFGSAELMNRLPDARRAAVILHTLEAISDTYKADVWEAGPFDAALKQLGGIWRDALHSAGHLDRYAGIEAATIEEDAGLFKKLKKVGFANAAIESWSAGRTIWLPVVCEGAPVPAEIELMPLIQAAWICRTRHLDRIEDVESNCETLLQKKGVPAALRTAAPALPRPAVHILRSRLYDLRADLSRFQAVFSSNVLDRSDINAVSGRFLRLLSEQDFALRNLANLSAKVMPGTALQQVIDQRQGKKRRFFEEEILSFLGGVLMRRNGLDQGVCSLAEAMLVDLSRMTGVDWHSRVVVGTNPLFSPPTGMVHVRFPGTSLWDLPLMAHEFGHITAFATPEFLELLAKEISTARAGLKISEDWKKERKEEYDTACASHIHEFFADAFAVYSFGPAFVLDVLLLHFNPAEAYADRGVHPTHAERVELILTLLKRINASQADIDNPSPYASLLNRARSWWPDPPLYAPPADEIVLFHRLKAQSLAQKMHALLDSYYRLGAQYEPADWLEAQAAAAELPRNSSVLKGKSLRQMLNIAWAVRLRRPELAEEIAETIRQGALESIAA